MKIVKIVMWFAFILIVVGCENPPSQTNQETVSRKSENGGEFFYSLVDMYKVKLPIQETYNTSDVWIKKIEKLINVSEGDILRITGQFEATNNAHDYPVRFSLKSCVNDVDVGLSQSENIVFLSSTSDYNTHHLPLMTDGVYVAQKSETVDVSLWIKIDHSGRSVIVRLEGGDIDSDGESGYSYLMIEHYSRKSTLDEVLATEGYCLKNFSFTNIRSQNYYGATADNYYTIYQFKNTPYLSDDIIRLAGSVLVEDNTLCDSRQFVGLRFMVGGKGCSAFSTTNNTKMSPSTPVFSNSYYKCTSTSDVTFDLSCHNKWSVPVYVGDKGYSYGMIFSRDLSNGCYLIDHSVKMHYLDAVTSIVANSGIKTLITTDTIRLKQGDIIRVVGHSEFDQMNYAKGILCSAYIVLENELGTVAVSPITKKYVTRYSEVLPLRNELIYMVTAPGDYKIKLNAEAFRSGANPTLNIIGIDAEGTKYTGVIVDIYRKK